MKNSNIEQAVWSLSVLFFCLWCISQIACLEWLSYYLSIPIFFFFLGRAIRVGILNRIGLARVSGDFLEEILIDIMISSIVTIAVGGTLAALYMLTATIVRVINIIMLGCLLFLWLHRIEKRKDTLEEKNEIQKLSLDHKVGLLAVIIFGAAFAVIRWSMFPFPATSGTDTFSHLAVINQIIHDQGSSNIISGGLYLYHALVAEFCILSSANPLWVISNIHTIVYPFSMVLIYQFLFYITKNSKISVVATIGTFSVFEHGGLLATYLPYTITFAFVLLYLCFLACYILEPSLFNIGLVLALAGIAILSYFYAAFAAIPLLVYLLVRQGFLPKQLSVLYKFLFGGIIIGGSILFLAFYVIFPSILDSTPEIQLAAFFTLTNNIDSALTHFTLAYSIWQTIGMIAGLAICWLAVFGKKMNHQWFENFNYEIIALLGTSYLIVFFAPISYAFRTELFARSINLLLIVTAASVTSILIINGSISILAKIRHVNPQSVARNSILLLVVMLLLLVPVCYEKTNRQVEYLIYGEQRNPTDDEMDAFIWLENNTSPSDYILTDMATGYILRGVIFRNASTSFTLDGRSKSANGFPELAQHIFDFINCTLHFIPENYTQLLGDTTLQNYTSSIAYIMISPRTNYWLSVAREGRFRRTAAYSFEIDRTDPSWSKFDSSYFDVSYSVGEIRILKLKSRFLPLQSDG